MTVADSKTSVRVPPGPPDDPGEKSGPSEAGAGAARGRSWLEVFRGEGAAGVTGADEALPGRKPLGDMADVLIMSMLDEKAPADAPGSADLMDALVQDHLDRAAENGAEDATAGAEEEGAASSTAEGAQPALTDGHRAELLQREIEMLLKGDAGPGAAGGAANAGAVPPAADATQGLDEAAATAGAAAVAAGAREVSHEELDILLAGRERENTRDMGAEPGGVDEMLAGSAAVAAELAAAAGMAGGNAGTFGGATDGFGGALNGGAALNSEETEEKLSEAEGVLAEELAQLMADTPGVAGDETGGATRSVEAEAGVAAEPAKEVVPEVGKVERAGKAVKGEPAVAARVQAAAGAEIAPAVAPAVPEAVAEARPQGVPEHPVVELLVPEVVARRGMIVRVRGLVGDVALMGAQLLDLPFAFVSELTKNVIGVAAFMLLLGGVVLWLLAKIVN